MMLSLFLATLIHQPAQQISFDFQVGRVDRAISALSKQTGVHLEARGDVASEVAFLKVNNLKLRDVMDSLARVTCAEWIKERSGTYVLIRSKAQVVKEREKETNRKLKALNAWRDDLVKCLNDSYTPKALAKIVKEKSQLESSVNNRNLTHQQETKARQRIQRLERYDPIYRALARCLRGLDLRPMAALPSQASVVFTLKPNSVQFRLPFSAIQATQNLQKEQLVWGKALRRMPIPKGKDSRVVFSTDNTIRFFEQNGHDDFFGADTDPWTRTLPFEEKPSLIVLTATCDSEDAYRFDLNMFTSDEQLVMSFHCGDISTYVWPKGIDSRFGIAGKSDVKPSSEMKAMCLRYEETGEKVKPALITLQRFFDDPINNDPLWIGNQELLTALSLNRKKSVIACIPDSVGCYRKEHFNLSDFSSDNNLTLTELPGCIEVRPVNFVEHWHQRVDRDAMAACLKDYREKGKIDLLSYVRMLAHVGEHTTGSYCGDFVQLLDPDYRTRYESFEIPFQSAFAPLLSSLSAQQLDRIKAKQTIPYRELTASQIAMVRRIVYGIRVNVHEEGGTAKASAWGSTFELPKGVLDGIGLSGEIGEDRIAVFHNGVEGYHDDFYWVNLDHTGPYEGIWSGPPPRIPPKGMSAATVTLHLQSYILLKCGLSSGHWVLGRFSEPIGKALGKGVLIKDLPDDVQKKIAKSVEFLKSFEKYMVDPNDQKKDK